MARTPLSGCRALQQSMYTKADLAPGLQHADFPAAPRQALGLQQGEGDVGGLAVLTLKAWPGQPCWFIFKWHFVSSEKRGDISDVRHAGRGTAVPLRHKPLFVLLSIRPPVTSCRCCDVPARTG